MQQRQLGAIQAIFASIFFGFIPFFTIPLYELGFTSDLTLFYRFGTACLIMGVILLIKRQSFAITRSSLYSLALHGTNYFLIALFLFLALSTSDSGIVTTIFYTNPVFVLVLSVFFFKERLELYKLVLILCTSFGVAMLSGVLTSQVNISVQGMIFSLLAGLGYAFYIILLMKFPASDLNRDVFSFYLFLFGALSSGIYTAFSGNMFFPTEFKAWYNIFGSAFITGVVSNLLLIYALPKIGTVFVAIFGVMEPLTAVFIGILVFNEEMNMIKALGIIVIVISIMLLTIIPKLCRNKI